MIGFIRKRIIFRRLVSRGLQKYKLRKLLFKFRNSIRNINLNFWNNYIRSSKRKFKKLTHITFFFTNLGIVPFILNYNNNLRMTYAEKLAYLDKTSLSRAQKLKLLRRA